MMKSIFGNGKCYVFLVKDGHSYLSKVEENWKNTTDDRRGEFNNYFVYQQCTEEGRTFCDRIAKPGYEYLQHNGNNIDKIIEEVKKHDSKNNIHHLDS